MVYSSARNCINATVSGNHSTVPDVGEGARDATGYRNDSPPFSSGPGSVDDMTNSRYRPPGRRWHIALCEWCGRDFDAARRTARYCRDACRQAAYRARRDNTGAGPVDD